MNKELEPETASRGHLPNAAGFRYQAHTIRQKSAELLYLKVHTSNWRQAYHQQSAPTTSRVRQPRNTMRERPNVYICPRLAADNVSYVPSIHALL